MPRWSSSTDEIPSFMHDAKVIAKQISGGTLKKKTQDSGLHVIYKMNAPVSCGLINLRMNDTMTELEITSD